MNFFTFRKSIIIRRFNAIDESKHRPKITHKIFCYQLSITVLYCLDKRSSFLLGHEKGRTATREVRTTYIKCSVQQKCAILIRLNYSNGENLVKGLFLSEDCP